MLQADSILQQVDPADRLTLVIDQFLHPKIFLELVDEVNKLQGWKPEYDHLDLDPIGMSCEIEPGSKIYNSIYQELEKLFSKPWKLYRFFANKFQPKEIPQFHRDGNAVTCVLFADTKEWDLDDHGETQLLINGEVRGILPVPNRLLVFDGRLMHRATSFQARVRHTIALHLDDVGFADIIMPGSEAPARLT